MLLNETIENLRKYDKKTIRDIRQEPKFEQFANAEICLHLHQLVEICSSQLNILKEEMSIDVVKADEDFFIGVLIAYGTPIVYSTVIYDPVFKQADINHFAATKRIASYIDK